MWRLARRSVGVALSAWRKAEEETGVRVGGLFGYNAQGSKWTFLFGGRYDYLGDEVDDSSITENDYQYALFGGFTYAFGK